MVEKNKEYAKRRSLARIGRRRSKFNAKKTTFAGITFASKMEAKYAMDLEFRKLAGDIREWSSQYPIQITVNGEKICKYVLDFAVTHNDHSLELVEVKGYKTSVWRLKWKLLKATYCKEHPLVKLTLVE